MLSPLDPASQVVERLSNCSHYINVKIASGIYNAHMSEGECVTEWNWSGYIHWVSSWVQWKGGD